MLYGQNLTAKEIVKKADDKMRGESSQAEMTMQIIRPTWTRTVKFKSWGKGYDYSLTLITEPAAEKGKSFLKRKNEMWNWDPAINRMIKLPPSMLSQGWMGSDYINDDILKESSIVNDYEHQITGSENIAGKECYKIQLIPKATAAVVWGKIVLWISKNDFLQLQAQYFDEDNVLVKTEKAYDIKKFGDRELPSRMEIQPADEKGNKTVVTINNIKFNVNLQDNFFSQQNMKTIK